MRVSSGGTLRDSLVGLAPFLGGTAVLLLVGYQIFNVAALGAAWQSRRLGGGGWLPWPAIWPVPDFWLWAYVLFVASNAMIPSPADRQPWLHRRHLRGLGAGHHLPAGRRYPRWPDAVIPSVAGALQFMTLAFVFTLVLDLIAAAILWLIEVVIVQVQRRT